MVCVRVRVERVLLELVSLILSLPMPETRKPSDGIESETDAAAIEEDTASTLYDSAASLRQKLESLNRFQFSTLKKYVRNKEESDTAIVESQKSSLIDFISLETNFSLKGELEVYLLLLCFGYNWRLGL